MNSYPNWSIACIFLAIKHFLAKNTNRTGTISFSYCIYFQYYVLWAASDIPRSIWNQHQLSMCIECVKPPVSQCNTAMCQSVFTMSCLLHIEYIIYLLLYITCRRNVLHLQFTWAYVSYSCWLSVSERIVDSLCIALFFVTLISLIFDYFAHSMSQKRQKYVEKPRGDTNRNL